MSSGNNSREKIKYKDGEMLKIKNVGIKTFTLFFLFLCLFLFAEKSFAQGVFRGKIRAKIKEKLEEKRQGGQQIVGAGDYDLSLVHGGLKRTYKVHVPSSYDRSVPMPLVLAFHGGGGSSEMMANDSNYHLISKSDREGFIAVFPNGASRLRSGKLATWNAGNCCGYARDNDIDDVGFVKAIIDDLEKELNIDRLKIYAVGFSNGGMFCYRLASELPDIFRAIASVAGTDNYDGSMPSKPVSVLHIHAGDDGHVIFNGGAGPDAFRDASKVTNFTSVPETVSRWVGRDRCEKNPQRVIDEEGVYCDLYSGCDGNAEVMLCVTETGGHSWPGGAKYRGKADLPSRAISATDTIWDFFRKQS